MRFEYADARMPVAMTKGNVTYYLGYDQVGTLKVVADASGNVIKKIEYDTFGNVLSDSNAAFAVPFGFAGGLNDKDTGLVRFGYRDYDPETGRWTAKDPILFAGGDTDLYGYCLNDPVNATDPDGLRMAEKLRPDIVITDVGLPGTDGISLTRKITERLENTCVMIFSVHEKIRFVVRSLQAGAKGYVLKRSGPACILKCLDSLAAGKVFVDKEWHDLAISLDVPAGREMNVTDRYGKLTPREQDVMRLTAEGLTPKEIGTRLFISRKTVSNHRSSIVKKLGLKNTTELIKYAAER